jgi:hypothetical protein
MRISFRVPGYVYDENVEEPDQQRSSFYVYDENADRPIQDPSILSALDGWQYEGGNIYNYIDMELVDHGVIGGTIRATWTPDRGLEVVTDYWAPDSLDPSYIDRLRAETLGQLSDGIGEGGFEIAPEGRQLVLVAHTDQAPDVEQVYDGKPVPMPSKIAQAARDGNVAMLSDALASDEAIDSTIQAYSGLHLAILHGHVDAALLLISKGANPNLLTGDGDETPLHLCALSSALSDSDSAVVAEALLRNGADKSATTASGNTAASFAEARHKIAMLKTLKAADR